MHDNENKIRVSSFVTLITDEYLPWMVIKKFDITIILFVFIGAD